MTLPTAWSRARSELRWTYWSSPPEKVPLAPGRRRAQDYDWRSWSRPRSLAVRAEPELVSARGAMCCMYRPPSLRHSVHALCFSHEAETLGPQRQTPVDELLANACQAGSAAHLHEACGGHAGRAPTPVGNRQLPRGRVTEGANVRMGGRTRRSRAPASARAAAHRTPPRPPLHERVSRS
jgi:hypothetical protein